MHAFTLNSRRSPPNLQLPQHTIYTVTPANDKQQSSRSTHLSSRSSSRQRMMIAQSPKLTRFFKQTPATSSQKSLPFSSKRHIPNGQNTEPRNKKEFLANANDDYFGQFESRAERLQVVATDRGSEWKRAGPNRAIEQQKQSRKQSNSIGKSPCLRSIKSLGQLQCGQKSHCKALTLPVDQVIRMDRKKEGKRLSSCKNLEYTFGLGF